MEAWKNWRSAAVKDKRPEPIHAGYPRLEDGEPPIAARALPLCYAHDYHAPKAPAEPRTYERSRVTCAKCLRVVAKYPQLGPVLDLAFEFERGLS